MEKNKKIREIDLRHFRRVIKTADLPTLKAFLRKRVSRIVQKLLIQIVLLVCLPISAMGAQTVMTWETARFSERSLSAGAVFDNKLWLIGGLSDTPKNDVWSSDDGTTWKLLKGKTPFPGRYNHSCTVFKNRLWVIGGSVYSNPSQMKDVWSSANGTTWTLITPSASFGSRSEHTCTVFKNKLWIIGGGYDQNSFKGGVWSSDDGVSWTVTNATAPWTMRWGHTATVFNSRLYVIGGTENQQTCNDVWCSDDGVSWTQVTAAAPFPARRNHTCTVFMNKLWVIAGNDDSNSSGKNDIWSSSDGVSWNQEAPGRFSPRYGCISQTFQNKLWIIGKSDVWSSADGVDWELKSLSFPSHYEHSSVVFKDKMWVIGNDILNSEDGINWSLVLPRVPFPSRGGHTTVVFQNKLWLIGGGSGGSRPAVNNDIWSSTDGVSWVQETPAAEFSKRVNHACVVFNNKMWVMGGQGATDVVSPTGEFPHFFSDVWSSANGVNWQRETSQAFIPRCGHTSVVFQNKLWVIGGALRNTLLYPVPLDYVYPADDLSSGDGISWTRETEFQSCLLRQNHSSVVFKEKIWVIGGLHDIWSSKNGRDWTQQPTGEFVPPEGHTSLVFHDMIWVIGGSGSGVWHSKETPLQSAALNWAGYQ